MLIYINIDNFLFGDVHSHRSIEASIETTIASQFG